MVDFTKEQLGVEPFICRFYLLLLNVNDYALRLLICHTWSQLVLLNSALSVRSIEGVMSVIKPGLDVQHAQSGLVFLIQLCLVSHSFG